MNALAPRARRLALQTPEGVPLGFTLAPLGARVLALGIDLLIVVLLIVGAVALAGMLIGAGEADRLELGDDGQLLDALVQLTAFALWNFYFVFTELRWQGRTVGKRALGLRVVARDGGPLSADLVFARNLTRDVETLVPLLALLYPDSLGLDTPWLLPIVWLWLGVMALMPLFNRLHARVGDLIAGTLVVEAPREALLADLAVGAPTTRDDLRVTKGSDAREAAAYVFSDAQLDLYGIHELQILEDVLRRYPAHIDHDLLVVIARKIRRKIGWVAPDGAELSDPEAYPFLRAFYSAQRARLEHKLLFGRRQERKRVL